MNLIVFRVVAVHWGFNLKRGLKSNSYCFGAPMLFILYDNCWPFWDVAVSIWLREIGLDCVYLPTFCPTFDGGEVFDGWFSWYYLRRKWTIEYWELLEDIFLLYNSIGLIACIGKFWSFLFLSWVFSANEAWSVLKCCISSLLLDYFWCCLNNWNWFAWLL